MNKKSKIKTTLDSLFTGGKIKPEDAKPESPLNTESHKTIPVAKVEDPAPPTKAAPVRQETQKPVEKVKSKETAKPEEVTEIKGIKKPVVTEKSPAIAQTKDTAAEEMQSKSSLTAGINQTTVQTSKPIAVEENPSALQVKATEVIAATPMNELDKQRVADLDNDEHLVIFSLGKELYGVTIHSVESIIKIQAITEVPKTASYVLGVTNLRGTVVPVLDLRKRFNLQFTDTTANTRIIIINAEGSKVGIVVDEVTEVLKVAQDSIQPPPPMSTTIESAFINGIAKINDKLVILLDLEKVLASSSRQYNR
jgi:purine-binding chemotaxis protein CheW